jgi:hypothetical protein
MIPIAAGTDGLALATQYEALRQDVVDTKGCRHVARGLALLMRKGMAAWMRGIEAEPLCGAADTATTQEVRLPEGIEQHLVDIVTAMALATTATMVGGVT